MQHRHIPAFITRISPASRKAQLAPTLVGAVENWAESTSASGPVQAMPSESSSWLRSYLPVARLQGFFLGISGSEELKSVCQHVLCSEPRSASLHDFSVLFCVHHGPVIEVS